MNNFIDNVFWQNGITQELMNISETITNIAFGQSYIQYNL